MLFLPSSQNLPQSHTASSPTVQAPQANAARKVCFAHIGCNRSSIASLCFAPCSQRSSQRSNNSFNVSRIVDLTDRDVEAHLQGAIPCQCLTVLSCACCDNTVISR